MSERRELVFFSDRDLGGVFPALLADAGVRIERHDDHFGPQTADEEWIGEIGRRGWVAITRDARIRYSPLALSVLMSSRDAGKQARPGEMAPVRSGCDRGSAEGLV